MVVDSNTQISIEYCMQWNYEPRALSLRSELTKKFGVVPKLIESGGGVYEIVVNNNLIFSKKQLNRFPNQGEVIELIRKFKWI